MGGVEPERQREKDRERERKTERERDSQREREKQREKSWKVRIKKDVVMKDSERGYNKVHETMREESGNTG